MLELVNPETTGGLIHAIGLLKYRIDKSAHITIQFPTKYPYSPPRIVPVIIKNHAGQRIIQENFYGKGNQYGDGKMCLIEDNEWDPNNYGIGWALRRAQKW